MPPSPIPVNQRSTDITSFPNKQDLTERKKSLSSNESLIKTTLSITQSENDDNVENWSENRVRLWFIENQLNLNIFEKMKPFDGSCLKEMFQVKKNHINLFPAISHCSQFNYFLEENASNNLFFKLYVALFIKNKALLETNFV